MSRFQAVTFFFPTVSSAYFHHEIISIAFPPSLLKHSLLVNFNMDRVDDNIIISDKTHSKFASN